MILKNAYVLINAVDLSAYVSEVDLTFDAEMQDDTVMGDAARSNAPGLVNATASITFKNPWAASGPDATLFPLIGAAPFAVAIRPVNTTIATTNPEYQIMMALQSWNPIGGAVGDEGASVAELVNGTGSIFVRDVTP